MHLISPSTQDLSQRTMPIYYFRQAYQTFGTTKAKQRAILEATGITVKMLDDPDSVIMVTAQLQQIRNLVSLIGEDFPFHAPGLWRPASQGLLEVVFRSAHNIAHGLDYLADHAWLRDPRLKITPHHADNGKAYSVDTTIDVTLRYWRPVSELVMLNLQSTLKIVIADVSGDNFINQIEYFWPWPPPDHVHILEQTLAGKHTYNTNQCRIFIPDSITCIKSPYADKALLALALSQLKAVQKKVSLPPALSESVKNILAQNDPATIDAEKTASILAISLRTLVRRLAAENTNFRKLRDDDLKSRAATMIFDTQMSRDAMAQALGYQDSASFNRSCKRWFGKSMRTLRNEQSKKD